MKVLVCGGRWYGDEAHVFRVLDELKPTAVAQGGATGADAHAAFWAKSHGVECSTYPADWERHGKRAGPIRNQLMLDLEKPDLVIAFPGGRGTADMVCRARAAGISVMEVDADTNRSQEVRHG